MGNKIYYSENGYNWNSATLPSLIGGQYPTKFSFENNNYIFMGGKEIFSSSDGINWTKNQSNISIDKLIKGDLFWVGIDLSGKLYYGLNLTDFHELYLPKTNFNAYQLFYCNGKYLIYGYDSNDSKRYLFYGDYPPLMTKYIEVPEIINFIGYNRRNYIFFPANKSNYVYIIKDTFDKWV